MEKNHHGLDLPPGVSIRSSGEGQLGQLVREKDWSKTPLGPMDEWPETLKGYVRMILTMPAPAIIFWGNEQIQIYNDGYSVIMGPRHPKYLGAPYRECWTDTYPIIYPWMRRVLDHGEIVEVDRALIPLTRHGFNEEAYFTFFFSPLRDDEGKISGFLQIVNEMTAPVLAERRLSTLRSLTPSEVLNTKGAASETIKALANNPHDVRFSLLFLLEAETSSLTLAGHCGFEPEVPLHSLPQDFLGLVQSVYSSNEPVEISNVQSFIPHSPLAPWPELTDRAMLLPIRRSATESPRGVIVLGVSPRLDFDQAYKDFFASVAREIASSLTAEDRSRLVEETERARQELSDFFMQAPAPLVVLTGPEHRFALVNPLYEEFVGRREVLGKTVLEAFSKEEVGGFLALLDRVYESGEPYNGQELELVLQDKDGVRKTRFINVGYHPFRESDGKIKGILAIHQDVTEQVLARRKTEESETRYHLASRATRDAIWDWNLLTNKVAWNEALHTEHGHPRETLNGDSEWWYEHIHPLDRERVVGGIHRAIDHGDRYWYSEYRFLKSNGSYATVLDRGYIERDRSGKPIRMIGAMQDVTDRKQAEEQLSIQKQSLELALRNAPIESVLELLTSLVERQTEFPTIASVLLLDQEGCHLRLGVAPNLPEEYNQAIDGLRIGPGAGSCGTAAYRGKTVIVRDIQTDPLWKDFKHLAAKFDLRACWSSPILSSRGKVLGTFALYCKEPKGPTDSDQQLVEMAARTAAIVLERKEFEDRIKAREVEFRSLANSIPQLAWMANSDGWIFWYNQRWFDYTGTTFEEMEGWGWKKVHHPDHIDRVMKFVEKAWSLPEPWELTFPLRSKFNEWRWFLTRATPVLDSAGKIVRWFGTNTDITEQKKSQEDLRNAILARDEFMSIASHELKTPLSSLKLQCQIMKRSAEKDGLSVYSPERVKQLIDQTDKQTSRLVRLVDDMLDITRLQTGKLTIKSEKMVLTDFIREVVERMSSQMSEAGTPVTYECESETVIEGEWDRLRIEQVIVNLLANAMRYGNRRPVRVKLEEIESGRCLLSVRDQGIGISPEAQKRIFNRFERAVSASEVSGLGLGLYISRQIVESHGGKIWVESEQGKGSVFYVELPCGLSIARHEIEMGARNHAI